MKTNVKHIAVKPPGAPRFFRLYKVRDDGTYSEENIKKRIIEQDLYFEKEHVSKVNISIMEISKRQQR